MWTEPFWSDPATRITEGEGVFYDVQEQTGEVLAIGRKSETSTGLSNHSHGDRTIPR
jgi:hypothetical protein